MSPTASTTAPPSDPPGRREASWHGPSLTNAQLLRWMFSFLRPVKGLMVVACGWLVLSIVAEIWAVRLTAEAVDRIKVFRYDAAGGRVGFWTWIASDTANAVLLRQTGLWIGLAVGLFAVLRYLREVAKMRMSMWTVHYIREAVYDKLQRVGFRFHDKLSSGQIINRALSDLQHVRGFIENAVLMTLEIVLIVLGYMILILTREPWVALLAVVPLPIWTWYILRFGEKVQPAAKAVMEAADRDVAILTENIAGVHVVKAFATEKREIARHADNLDAYYDRVLNRVRLFADFTPIIRLIAMASNLTLFLATALFILYGRMSAGDFVILGTAMSAILGRLQQVSTLNEQYQNAIVSSRRLHEVLAAGATVPIKPAASPLPPGRGEVTFEQVTFGYEPGKPVLKDVSFRAPAGGVVAVVGPTGAGKSTLVNLIARFYDPQQGRVGIDGADLRDVDLDAVRRSVGFVFQETYLFSDTVAANIAYGRPGVTDGMIEAAARLAQAHDFISELPQGYQTVIGERGSSLSGGQRQRLAIARAILHDPRVLVLDDATAAIDPETEDLIRRGMGAVLADRTVFVIAHRISSVTRADLVLVLEEGRLTQSGTHRELMAQDGHYREIAEAQLYGDDVVLNREGRPMSFRERLNADEG